MLGSEDGHPESAFFQHACPLAAVQLRGVEQFRRIGSVAPLVACEGVHSEMKECCQFKRLPFQLLRSRDNVCSDVDLLLQGGTFRDADRFLVICLIGTAACYDAGR